MSEMLHNNIMFYNYVQEDAWRTANEMSCFMYKEWKIQHFLPVSVVYLHALSVGALIKMLQVCYILYSASCFIYFLVS